MASQSRRRAATAVAVVLLGALGWLVAGPRQLGGSATYVVTRGGSMRPMFRTGDLAVVRPAPRYAVGDVVAYPSGTTGTNVLHRIVDVTPEGFVLKGDSNDWLDPEIVPAGAVVGRLAMRVPRGGALLGAARGPRGVAVAALLLVTTAGTVRTRRRTREEPVPTNSRLAGAAAATALLAGAAGLMYARPATVPGARDSGLRHETSLDYEAAVTPGPVYQDGRITTGETVFPAIAPEVGVRVGYRLAGPGADVAGTVTTEAVVSTDTGWSHRVALGSPVAFSGSAAVATQRLRFRDLDALVADVARRTGIPAGRYAVSLSARISVQGSADGRSFAATVEAPVLALAVDRGTVRPTSSAARPALAVTPVAAPADVPATIVLGGRRLPVASVRTAASAGAGVAALVTLALWAGARRAGRRPEPELLTARYGDRIVDVDVIHAPADRNVVEVAGVEALVAIADRFDRPVLHELRGGLHTYVVEHDRSLYRYRGAVVPPQRTVAAAHASAR